MAGIIGLFDALNNSGKEKVLIDEIKNKKTHAAHGPKYVVIDITNRCNLNCIACWTYSPLLKSKKPSPGWFKQELSYETLVDLVSDLKSMGTEEIRLTGGGEPFMHPRIIDIAGLIKKNKMKLDITTNFTLVNKEKIDKLVRIGADNITVSLWAASPGVYSLTHPNQKESAFERVMENLNYLCKIKKQTKVVISNVISNLNYAEIEEMMRIGAMAKADEIYFTMIDVVDGETGSLLLDEKQMLTLREKFNLILKKYKSGYYKKLIIDNPENFLRRISNDEQDGAKKGNYDSDIIFKIPCTIGWTFSRIMANGDVAPCCRGVMIPSGNINTDRFSRIWNNEKQKSFRRTGLDLKGNISFVEKIGCEKMCDNLMQNIEIFNKL